ncbi:MAG: mitochondrial fission ELM1 family protein [Maricaulis sp.]|nr:mitochondrial fission ELM1 family protein [Maricaulis sp.]
MLSDANSSLAKSCWVVSDGRRGIENQPLGLAEAVAEKLAAQGVTLEIGKVIARKDGFVTLPGNDSPDLWLGCGRAAVGLVRKHRRIFPDCFYAYVQDPRTRYRDFDLIIAPSHDRLRRENAVSMIGSPNRIRATMLSEGAAQFSEKLATLEAPRVAVLIGGDSKRFKLDKRITKYLLQRLGEMLDHGNQLMITVSRRTPAATRKALAARFGADERVWYFDGADEQAGDNPYFAFLAAADWILVTEESTNMLVEAAGCGKPVYVLPMAGQPGKFSGLHSALEGSGRVRPYLGQLDSWSCPPLDETSRISELLLERWLPTLTAQTGDPSP